MSQISVNSLTFNYEGSFDNIFENVSFSIDTNWKLGFIGRNGKGKTTFLDLLMGRYAYSGSISSSTKFEYFPYRLSDEQMHRTAAEFMDEIRPGCESWRVMCELSELSEQADILYRPFDTLSPGERSKVLLAILVIPFAMLIYTGIKTITAAIAFWTKKSGNIIYMFYMVKIKTYGKNI